MILQKISGAARHIGGMFLVSAMLHMLTSVPAFPLEQWFKETMDPIIQGIVIQATDARPRLSDRVEIIDISQADFDTHFQGKSPLSPQELTRLFQEIEKLVGEGRGPSVLGIDIDLIHPLSNEKFKFESNEKNQGYTQLYKELKTIAKEIPVFIPCIERAGSKLDAAGEARALKFLAPIQTASPLIDFQGLYFYPEKNALGSEIAHAYTQKSGTEKPSSLGLFCDTGDLDKENPELIVKRNIIKTSYSDTLAALRSSDSSLNLQGKVLLIGGTYGTTDRYYPGRSNIAYYGVELHAWNTAVQMETHNKNHKVLEIAIDIAVGLAFSALLGCIAKKGRNGTYARRNLWSIAYVICVFSSFGGLILLAAIAHDWGVSIATAGMVVSSVIDSFGVMWEQQEDKSDVNPPFTLADYAVYLSGCVLQLFAAYMFFREAFELPRDSLQIAVASVLTLCGMWGMCHNWKNLPPGKLPRNMRY